MAFDVSAFFGGVAKGVKENIEKQDEQIRDQALSEFDRLKKQATEQEDKVRTRRDDLKATASVLANYKGINNYGFTQGQIVGLLQNPSVAKRVMSVLDKNADELDQIDFSKLYKVTKGNTDQSVDDYIASRTEFKNEISDEAKQKAAAKKPAERGVFGIPTRARSRAESEFERSAGVSLDELRKKAKGIPDEAITAEGTLDFSQFKEPDSIDKQINRVGAGLVKARDSGNKQEEADLMTRLKTLQDVKETIDPEKNTYAAAVSAKKLAFAKEKDPARKQKLRQELSDLVQADKVGKSEAPSLTEYSSLLTKAERTALQNISGPVKGLVYDRDQGKFVYTGGDPSVRANVENARLAGIKGVVDLFSDADGRVSPDLQAALAASGVQFDENQKPILSIPVPAAAPPKERGTRGPRVQAGETGQAAPTAAPAGQEVVAPIPLTPDGKIDGSKLEAGKRYTSRNGTVKTWTGSGWQ